MIKLIELKEREEIRVFDLVNSLAVHVSITQSLLLRLVSPPLGLGCCIKETANSFTLDFSFFFSHIRC